ncbi:MAG: hypothetical protein HYX67_02465 [Candidatus Melainabacteria bacterium]|nr:hypothetical protein [Candidatus Melainabacteria bacterium]
MANNLSKPEQNGLRTTDPASEQDKAAHDNFFHEFANATVYSALEQPALGISQFFGTDASKKVTGIFSSFGIEAPKADSSISGWTANTLGGAVGMLLPFALTKGGLSKAGVFGEAAESGLLSQRSTLGLTLKESAYTGFVYGSVLTPSKETDSAGTLLKDRLLGGVGSAATFTTLTAGSFGLGRLAETNIAGRLGVDVALRNPILAGSLSGLPAGIVSSEYDSLTKNGTFASASELGQSMAGMALVGGVFGAKAKFEPHLANGSTYIADALRSKFNVPKFEASTQYSAGTGRDINEPLPIIQDGKSEPSKPAETAPKPPPVDLLPEEHRLLSQINNVTTASEWKQLSNHIEENGRLETSSWFGNQMERQAASLSNSELQTLWPQIIKNDPAQAYRIAKEAGTGRTQELWQSQLESVRQTPDPELANGLSRLLVVLEPSKQLAALDGLLKLDKPPESLSLASTSMAPENQLAAAKMLVRDGISPYLERTSGSASEWSKWIFDEPPGEMREKLLTQLGKKIAGSSQSRPAELNEIYQTAQVKAEPSEFEALRGMLHGADPRNQTSESAQIRKTALDGLDPKFVGRLFFHEHNWDASDRIAQTHPDLIKALAENTRLNGSIPRNDYLASLMTGEPPLTATKLAESLSDLAQTSKDKGLIYPLSYGDLQALAEHGVKPAPNEVAPLLGQLRDDALKAFGMDQTGAQDISTARLLADMTLAKEFSKNNPELFDSEFKAPIEEAMSDTNLSYDRRLEAARALGELQRGGFDSAQAIHMPDLRMGKFAELTPQEQTKIRTDSEAALRDRASMIALLGDGALGRLMPSVFGDVSEGGIVGRKQHATHDNTVDVHLLDVMEKAGQDPRFKNLLPQDQTNTLWASFLHDVSKRENMVDLDHGWTSTSTAWGVLRTLGYPETQIQRITDIMGRDFDLSYDPDNKNSVRFQDQKALDDVITAYRMPGALDMVSILNASDIQSVKADGSWYTPEVIAELEKIRTISQDRVDYLNKNLLPVMTTEMPKGFGAHEMSDYNVMVHSSPDLTGQLLRHLSTIESPEFSMSVSLLTPDHRNTYTDFRNVNSSESQVVALVDGPFEHIAQAHRGNLSTGKSVGWDGHVELVRRWASDHRAERLATEAESKLADLNIPPDPRIAPENHPRLSQLRRILSQFNNLDDLTKAAGNDNQYVVAAHEINRILTTERDGSPLNTHNEIKINNPIVSSIGLLRNPNQTIFFEGVPDSALFDLWHGQIPDYVRNGEPGTAPPGSLVVTNELWQSAKANGLPLVVLNPRQ